MIGNQKSANGAKSWVSTYSLEHEPPPAQYITCLHWALAQFTPAPSNVHPCNVMERVYASVILIFGLVAYSSFLSNITSLLTETKNRSLERRRQLTSLRRFLFENRISISLGIRVWAFVRKSSHCIKKRTHENELQVLQNLPKSLRLELRQEVYYPVISWHPLFENMTHCFKDVVSSLCCETLSQHSYVAPCEVFMRGDPASRMYFVVSGQLEYSCNSVTGGLKICPTLWIGEHGLWMAGWSYRGTLKAEEPSELYELEVAAFQKIVVANRRVMDSLRKYAYAFFSLACEVEVTDLPLDMEDLKRIAQSDTRLRRSNRGTSSFSLILPSTHANFWQKNNCEFIIDRFSVIISYVDWLIENTDFLPVMCQDGGLGSVSPAIREKQLNLGQEGKPFALFCSVWKVDQRP